MCLSAGQVKPCTHPQDSASAGNTWCRGRQTLPDSRAKDLLATLKLRPV